MKAIVIMAKEPRPNEVKTRLIPPFDPVTASRIYLGFLQDRIEQVGQIKEAHHFIAYTPESSRSFFEDICPSSFNLLHQKGSDLGERLCVISNSLFNKGYEEIVLMDSDSPNLPSRIITEVFQILLKSDVILGPCEDGGYYLIGLKAKTPEIFQDIPWSTPEVSKVTLEKARSSGKEITLLEKWYDVDTIEDLMRLKSELDAYQEAPSDIFFCKNTYRIISEII